MRRTPRKTSAVTTIILLMSIAALLWYAVFLFAPSHAGHPLAYALLILAECIGMSQLLSMWVTILFAGHTHPVAGLEAIRSELAHRKTLPSVAVLITVAGEPVHVVRMTATAARDMTVSHRTIILDDGSSDEIQALAQELNVEYIRRPNREGKKAGNINNALRSVKTDYVAVLDCDHVPVKEFLLETLPPLLAQPNLAFVQTPQSYGNTNTFIAAGSAEIQEVFYRHVQTGKNAFNAAFCVGTNMVLRRKAIDDIGGIYQKSNSEDIWTSLLLHEKGWDSLFIPTVLATGLAPETVDAHFRQQFRWARGGFEIFFTRNPLSSRTLSPDQKFQYLFTITHYLGSVAILVYFLLPLLYVYFGIKPLESPAGGGAWALHFFPYYLIIFASTIHLLGRVPSWSSLVIAATGFPSHVMALLSVMTGKDLRWSVTGEIRRSTDYIQSVIPQIILFLFSLAAIPLVLLQQENPWMNLLMAGWLTWNCALLFSLCRRAVPLLDRRANSPASAPSSISVTGHVSQLSL